MVDAAIDTFSEVDLIAVVIDASEASGGGDRFLLVWWPDRRHREFSC
jgi:hypothetical protein